MTVLCYGLRIMVLQTGRSRAPACQVSRLTSLHFKFLLTTSLNLRHERPWFLAPELNWEYRSCLGSLSASIRWAWPVYLRFRSISISVIGARPLLLYILSFDTLSFHVIFIVSLGCRIIYAFSFFTCVLYTVHVSAPYNRVERTIALYTLNFTRRPHDGYPTASLAASHKLRSLSPFER